MLSQHVYPEGFILTVAVKFSYETVYIANSDAKINKEFISNYNVWKLRTLNFFVTFKTHSRLFYLFHW